MAKNWVILDGDDTLWQTTPLYDAAIERLLNLAAAYGVDRKEVRDWVSQYDLEQARVMGYSMHRFPASLRAAAEHFMGHGVASWAALGYGYEVSQAKAQLSPWVLELFASLAGRWNIALLTAGETSVQEKRLKDFPLEDKLDYVRIVSHKDEATYRQLAHDLAMSPAHCWMVGDSLRSDIVPAAQAGFQTIHFDTTNWSDFEVTGQVRPSNTLVARTLWEVGELISGRFLPTKSRPVAAVALP